MYEFVDGASLQVYHSTDIVSTISDTTFNGIGGKDLKNHTLTSWAQFGERFVYFCDKIFKDPDPTDLKLLLHMLRSDTTIPCTKDSCVGYALRNQDSVSIRYKRPWKEITREFLKEVNF